MSSQQWKSEPVPPPIQNRAVSRKAPLAHERKSKQGRRPQSYRVPPWLIAAAGSMTFACLALVVLVRIDDPIQRPPRDRRAAAPAKRRVQTSMPQPKPQEEIREPPQHAAERGEGENPGKNARVPKLDDAEPEEQEGKVNEDVSPPKDENPPPEADGEPALADSASPPLLPVDKSTTDYRTWTDATGVYTFVAMFLRVEDDKVILKGRDDIAKAVPRDRLSKADLDYVATQLATFHSPEEAVKWRSLPKWFPDKDLRDRLVIVPDFSKPGEHFVGTMLETNDKSIRFRIEGELFVGDGGRAYLDADLREERTIASRDVTLLTTENNKKHLIYSTTDNRLVEVKNGRQLSEEALAYCYPVPEGRFILGDGRLAALLGALGGAKASDEDAGLIGGFFNAVAGAAVGLKVEAYERQIFYAEFMTRTMEGIDLKWKRDDIQVGDYGVDVGVTVTNTRHHPANLYVRGGYFRNGLPFPCELRESSKCYTTFSPITLGPKETKRIALAFPKLKLPDGDATIADIKAWHATHEELVDDRLLYGLIEAENIREIGEEWSELKAELDRWKKHR